jgi:DNA adenine methylase
MMSSPPLTAQSPPERPIVRYWGGKWSIAPWIISHFPEHRVYIEPFGGGASVLLRKPASRVEIYNDLSDDIVNVFKVLRDPSSAQELMRLIALTPYSRVEWETSYESSADRVESARRFIVRCQMGFSSMGCNPDNSNGFRSSISKPVAVEFQNYSDALPAIISRLRDVCIEHMDAIALISLRDASDVLFYLDPPYVTSTRNSSGKGYACEMSDEDHSKLLGVCRRLSARVMISGYGHPLYHHHLADWHRVEKAGYAGGQKGRSDRNEILWMNFAPSPLRPSRPLRENPLVPSHAS